MANMVTVPGVMGQMSEATAKAAGYTNYTPVANPAPAPVAAPSTPAEGTTAWYLEKGLQPNMGIPSTAQDIVNSNGAGLPSSVLSEAQEAVTRGEGDSPQVAIRHIEQQTGSPPTLDVAEVVKAYGVEGATNYLQKAGVQDAESHVQTGSIQLQYRKNIEDALGKNYSTIGDLYQDDIDKIVIRLGTVKAEKTLDKLGYPNAEKLVQESRIRTESPKKTEEDLPTKIGTAASETKASTQASSAYDTKIPSYKDIPTLKLTPAEKDFLVQQYYPEKLDEWNKLRPKYRYEQSMYRVTPKQRVNMVGIGAIETAALMSSPLLIPAILVLGGYTAYKAIQAVRDFRTENGRDMTAKDAAFEIQNTKPVQEAVKATDMGAKGETYEYVQVSSSLPPVNLSKMIAAHREVYNLEKPLPTYIVDNWPHSREDLIDGLGFDPSIMVSASAQVAVEERPAVQQAALVANHAWQNYDKSPNTAIGKTKEWLDEFRTWQRLRAEVYAKGGDLNTRVQVRAGTALQVRTSTALAVVQPMEPTKPSTKHHGTVRTIYLAELIAQGATKDVIKAAKRAWTKAKYLGMTDSQAKTAAQNAVKEAIKESTKTDTSTATQTRADTRTATQTRTATNTAEQTRTGDQTRTMDDTRTQTRTRTRTKPLPGGGNELQIEHVEGIPPNPGIVTYEDGIVKVILSPPYREGTEDVGFDRLKVTRRGKGSQEATLKVSGGQAPKLIQLSRGISKTSILKGKRMTHTRQGYSGRGPGIMDSQGRVHKQRRGSVI